jgi:hypothetical protein
MAKAATDPKFPSVTKLEAARRQLETAALLYFNSRDTVSMHTLAANAYQIMEDLSARQGTKMLIEQSMVATLGEDIAKELRSHMRRPQNFFKHATRPNEPESLEYSPKLTELMLLDAYGKLMQLTGEQPRILLAFENWFFMHHLEMLDAFPPQRQLMEEARKLFGDLNRLTFLQEFLRNTCALRP